MTRTHATRLFWVSALFCAISFLGGCGGEETVGDDTYTQNPDTENPDTENPVVVNPPSGEQLSAQIRRTDYGVPHIKADDLESLAFGIGYAFSQDNACLLLDIVTRYNSQRSKYYGPDKIPGSGDLKNLVTDFSFLALGIREQAEQGYASQSDNTKALLSGYSKGFNHYLDVTGSESLDPNCAGKPWVRAIDELDLLTVMLGTALLPGSAYFLESIFLAAPPNTSYEPTFSAGLHSAGIKSPLKMDTGQLVAEAKQTFTGVENPAALGSNGWAIGSQLSKNGKGMLLANPHFPFAGILRFWQFHATIPGQLDVMGSSLAGLPGVVNLGFNNNLAWTHTYSTAEHIIVYELDLDESDPSGLTYIVDGEPRTIVEKTLALDVLLGNSLTPVYKKVYYSDFGPMIVLPDMLPWGVNGLQRFAAYSLKDANKANSDMADHWLAMNMASNMEEFKQAFKQYDGVIFNNTIATDRDGNTFYIDDSTVPNLSQVAETELRNDPELRAAREYAGFSFLRGTSERYNFDGAVPYEKAPKLERTDYVQNTNDSYWLTNPNQPLEGYPALYGYTNSKQSLRSRMSHRYLASGAGADGLFTLDELESVLFSERAFLAEAVLDDLLELCGEEANKPVSVQIESEGSLETVLVDIEPACVSLSQWDGLFKKDSRGAHVFREFAQQFQEDPQWKVPFNEADPINTPNTLDANDEVLRHLARAVLVLEKTGIPYNAALGDVQFVELSNLDGTASGEKLPWEGANNIEGGFNVFHGLGNDNSLIPRHSYATVSGSQISAEGQGYHINQGSSWIMLVNFTEQGVDARGLMTYSQSIDPTSEHRDDQTRLYSEQPRLQPLYFTEDEIKANTLSDITVELDLD